MDTARRAAKPPRIAQPEPVIAICPNCFTQLPNTGVYDNCSEPLRISPSA